MKSNDIRWSMTGFNLMLLLFSQTVPTHWLSCFYLAISADAVISFSFPFFLFSFCLLYYFNFNTLIFICKQSSNYWNPFRLPAVVTGTNFTIYPSFCLKKHCVFHNYSIFIIYISSYYSFLYLPKSKHETKKTMLKFKHDLKQPGKQLKCRLCTMQF